jgi:hypothetical protein
MSPTWVFPVTTAGPQTIALEAGSNPAGAQPGDLSLSALYVPFGSITELGVG